MFNLKSGVAKALFVAGRPTVPSSGRRLVHTEARLFRAFPGYQINETDTDYKIAVNVPGIKVDNMTVNLEDHGRVVHIAGGRKVEKEGTTTEMKFERRFTIGHNIEGERMKAHLEDGVLTLTAPKVEEKTKPGLSIEITEGPTVEETKEA